jgi:hypothetical protein
MSADDLVIWRDSVAAGDDVDAPHEWRVQVDAQATVAEVAARIQHARYLASITGGRATWILMGTGPLAVLAQEWDTPRCLTPPDAPIRDAVRQDGRPHLALRYWCQVDPERVLLCLQLGEPLPDRYGA